ncbi:MAG TPA: bifunctional adenosylcobinamide kinase/adenosylcobinamide-phosphate guanylyltransferase [Syntrophus sp. (in: bacteria)]|nr:bifunctional adenosylcobinamide kinase/adenosylcobinamide-phosphate guanylyltransferase [Syntrophus sp. (in: bacteria)]
MAQIVVITGGSRSGKSTFAQQLAESLSETRTYLATCPVIDGEMADRIEKHRRDRQDRHWHTIEEEIDLAGALGQAAWEGSGKGEVENKKEGVILVDCLTLWINNLLYQAERRGASLSEADIVAASQEVLQAGRSYEGTVIFVSNEVGLGIVPDHFSGRLFRDLAGRCNQVFAKEADAVVFMVSGIPMWIKGKELR